jgi:hypothetical protein
MIHCSVCRSQKLDAGDQTIGAAAVWSALGR